MKTKNLFISLFLIIISCNKESLNNCEINKDDLVGDYCSVNQKYFSGYYSIEKISLDTFQLSYYYSNLKFYVENSSLVFPKQKVEIPDLWHSDGTIDYKTGFYSGTGNINCSTGLINLSILEEFDDSHNTTSLELLKSSEIDFTGTFISNDNDAIVELSMDSESDSLIIKVNMNYTNYQDSLLIEIKAFSSGCIYSIDYEISDSTRIKGFITYKSNNIYIQIDECLICEECLSCTIENTLVYWIECCDHFFLFEGSKTD